MEKGFQTVNLHGCASGVIATPVIGENGNWYIGNDNTGVSAKGDQGEPGPAGSQGSKGDQGEIGPAGPQGIQGIPSEKGEKGDTGATGSQGLKGDIPELVANLEQTVTGKALDATMGKTLNDKIVDVNDSLGGLSFYEDSTGKYVVGADSVPKKLGSGRYRIYIQSRAGIDGATTGAYCTAYYDLIDGEMSSGIVTASVKDWSGRVTCASPSIVSVEEI